MLISPDLWPKLHGASTHFPVALIVAAAFFDSLGILCPAQTPHKSTLHAAGYYTIILGALSTFPAVLSGLFLTRGEVLGQDALLRHHLFIWPAFVGLVGLGVWRSLRTEPTSTQGLNRYLVVLLLTTVFMAGAGYWGGELILSSR